MTTITDTIGGRPPAEYMREVKKCAKERRKPMYVYRALLPDDGWVSTSNFTMVPFCVQVWSVSPTGFVTTFRS